MANTTSAPVPAIDMRGVSVGALRDLGTTVLEGVNWTVNPGEYWVVAGFHNCGKTDLLSLVAGLMPPQSGEYRLFGRTMPIPQGQSLADRLRVGLVFDGGQLLPQLTVRENVALPLRYHMNLEPEEAEPQVEKMLEKADLLSWANDLPGAVGRNIHKRAGLARALMMEPELLVVDNPLGDVDRRQAIWWLKFLDDLSANGTPNSGRPITMVVSASDLRPWHKRAGHFALLRDKRMVTLDGEIPLVEHSDPLVQELLAEEPIIS